MDKILIIRFSSIGDIVLTSPVVRCLKKQMPEAEIHYLTKPAYKEILENNPYIQKLHLLHESLGATIQGLKKENFDVIIDLHHNLRTWIIKRRLAKKAYSFRKLNIEKWILVNLKIDRLPDVHIVERYMDTLKSLHVDNDGMGLDYFLGDDVKVDKAGWVDSSGGGYVVFAIGAKHFTKRLPLKKIINICREIDKPIILIGGEEDRVNGTKIADELNGKVFNTCGKLSINQSAAVIKDASKVITHDTGMMHIAAAFKKDIISVWGNTIPKFGMTPYLPDKGASVHKLFEINNLPCRPCSKLGHSKCPKKHFYCMELIDEIELANAVNEAN